MSIDPRLMAQMRALCAELYADDGADPRQIHERRQRRHDDTHLRRLCGQITRALALALAEHGGPLAELRVHAVRPGERAGHLVVELCHPDPTPALRRAAEAARGWLRAEAAQAIHRKRVPELAIRLVPTAHPEEAP